jgi:hypothetical protein
MIDTFILCCHNTEYLKHASHYDRNDPKRQSWFEPGTLALTCSTYLPSAPQHLLKPEQRASNYHNSSRYQNSTSERDSTNRNNPYVKKKINRLLDINEGNYTIPPSGIDKIVAQLATADPKDPICLLCRDESNPHRWTDCSYIQDTEFNKSVSIRLATVLNRTMKESQKRNQSDDKQLHALLQDTNPSSDDTPFDEHTPNQDFLPGSN